MRSGCRPVGMHRLSVGYVSDMAAQLPLLIAIGFAPVAVMLLLVLVTRLENTLPFGGDSESKA